MTLRTYLKLAIALTAIDAVVISYFYSAGFGDSLFRPFFVIKGAVDVLFILVNWRNIRPSRFEIALISFTLIHAIAGLIVLPMISTSYVPARAANDVIWPILFLLKVVIFRGLINNGGLSSDGLKMLVRWAFYLSIIQVVIFIIFSRMSGAYAGITPPVNLPLSYGLAFSQPWFIGVSLVAIILSGKRSFLLGALVAIGLRALIQRKNRMAFMIAASLAFALLAFAIGGSAAGILPEDIDDKLKQMAGILDPIKIAFTDGPSAIFDESVRHDLYIASAGRSEEIFGIVSHMSWYNIFIGLGAGFTYSYMHWEGWVDGYANSHFSPLALTYKFGIIYAICMYAYISKGIVGLIRSNDRMTSMVGFGLVMFLVQSLFAFNLFVEIFFPFLVALRQVAERTAVPVSNVGRRGDGGSDVRA